jgi:cytoskeleton protein RodZ
VLVAMLGSAAALSRDGSEPTGLSAGTGRPSSPAPTKPKAEHATPPPGITGINAVITTIGSDPSWVKVTADGATVFEQTVSGPETHRFRADNTLELTLGSAGAVRLAVNGKPVPTGSLGEVQRFGWAVRNDRLVRT